MLSYRHSFHAGNHADVLKHVLLVELLRYLTAKPKGLWYIDTHAGAGIYELGKSGAGRKELDTGIARIWRASDAPPLVRRYLALVGRANPSADLEVYPGSPWFANEMLRPGDKLWLSELHPADFTALTASFDRRDRRIRIERQDGFAGLRALLPPAPKRALVLVDPSYERAAEFREVADALADARRRFPNGVYAVWYPMLRSRESRAFPRLLKDVAGPKWLRASLAVREPGAGGLYGSGLFVINPPYTFAAALETPIRWLERMLAQDSTSAFEIESADGC